MRMCIQNLVSIYLFFSQDIGQKPNSDINQGPLLCCKFEKKTTMIYDTNIDLVNDNVYKKFGLNRSIRFQDIEQKLNSDDDPLGRGQFRPPGA